MPKVATYRKNEKGEKVAESHRAKYERLYQVLDNEYMPLDQTLRDISDFIAPHRQRFDLFDVNQSLTSEFILDNTASESADLLAAAMMGGITSTSRPFFLIRPEDENLEERPDVEQYIWDVQKLLYAVLAKCNIYDSFANVHYDVELFANSPMYVEENMDDFDKVIHTEVWPIGSYRISANKSGDIDTIFRTFRMTVRQLIEKFGQFDSQGNVINWQNFSGHVKALWDNCEYEQWIDVRHVIKPNEDFNPEKSVASRFKRYVSAYYEKGCSKGSNYDLPGDDYDKMLRVKGYDYFPVLMFQWRKTGEDSWGKDSPGWRALPDTKQLQQGESFILSALEKIGKPPLLAQPTSKTSNITQVAGEVTYDAEIGDKQIKPLYLIEPDIQKMEYKQEAVRGRIKRTFKEDLFLIQSTTRRPNMTATEVEAIEGEKNLVIGPVLEQFNKQLKRLIDILYAILDERGMLPKPPQDLEGKPLKIEFVSIMHAAQKVASLAGMDRFMTAAIQIKSAFPEAGDSVAVHKYLEEYGVLASMPPGIVRSQEEVDAISAERAKMQQAMAAQEAIQAGAGAAKDLAGADMSGDNALTALMGR